MLNDVDVTKDFIVKFSKLKTVSFQLTNILNILDPIAESLAGTISSHHSVNNNLAAFDICKEELKEIGDKCDGIRAMSDELIKDLGEVRKKVEGTI